MGLQSLCTFLLFVASSCSAYFTRESFITVVPSQQKTCFSKTFTHSIKVIFEFSVTEGGNKDIDVRVISPNGLVIFKELKAQRDEISFNAQNGDFKFCFSNEFSKVTNKRIAFNIRPFDEASLAQEAGEKDGVPKVRSAIEAFCDNIHFLMTTVVDFQMKYMVHESMGRYVAENLNKRVMWWSLGQALVIFIVGFGQVFIFKKFFTDTRPRKPVESVVTTQ